MRVQVCACHSKFINVRELPFWHGFSPLPVRDGLSFAAVYPRLAGLEASGESHLTLGTQGKSPNTSMYGFMWVLRIRAQLLTFTHHAL